MEIEKIAQSDSRYLCFSLGKEEFALPLLRVREVIALPEITPVPFTPSYFVGIMNLRGQVISVIDLRQKFGINPSNSTETAVIICDLSPISIGIVADSVNFVLAPRAGEVSVKPAVHSHRNTEYITAVCRRDNRIILFLDVAKSLNLEDHSAIARSSAFANAA